MKVLKWIGDNKFFILAGASVLGSICYVAANTSTIRDAKSIIADHKRELDMMDTYVGGVPGDAYSDIHVSTYKDSVDDLLKPFIVESIITNQKIEFTGKLI